MQKKLVVVFIVAALVAPVFVARVDAQVSDRVLAVAQAMGNNPLKAAAWLMKNLTTEQKLAFEAYMIPPPSDAEKIAALQRAKAQLETAKLDTDMSTAVAAIDAKIAEIKAAISADQ